MTAGIIGRERELAALEAVIDRAPGAPPNLVLHGDPGVGKTVLLRAGVDHATRRGIRLLDCTGYETEAELAFSGLYQLFAPVMEYLDRVEPFQRSVIRRILGFEDGPTPTRLAISAAAFAVLLAVAEDGPVLIAVEDAHWVDQPTRDVALFILLRLPPWDIRAIFARRSLTSAESVSPGVNMVEVLPLAASAADELLRLLHPDLPPAARSRVLQVAAGNPLALAELPAVLGTEAAVGLELLPATAPLRTKLELAYAGRVLSLPAETRSALLLTALDSDRLEPQYDAPQATVLGPEDVVEVERLGLVSRDSTAAGLRFRHPLVRSAIVNTASPAEVRAAHATLAAVYKDQIERRFWHLAAATVEPDEDVAAEVERGARAVRSRGGAGLAVAALQRAAGLSPAPADAARRLQDAAELAGESGQLDLAPRLVEQARRYLDTPAQSRRRLATTGQVLLRRDGDLAGAFGLLKRSLEVDADHDAADVAEATVRTLILAASYAAGPAEWGYVEQVIFHLGSTLSEETRLLFDALGDVARTGHQARHQLTTAFAALPPDPAPSRVVELCLAAARLDTLGEHRHHFRRLVDRETGSGALTAAASGYWFEALDRFLSGEWELSEQAANTGLELCVGHGLALGGTDFWCILGQLAAGRGDIETVRELSRTIERWAAPRGSGLHLMLSARNLALAALSQGDYETAYAECVRISPVGQLAPYAAPAPWAVLDLVEAALHTGRSDEARAHVAAGEQARLADLTPRLRLHAFAARAVAAPDEQAPALFRQALALPRIEQWPFDHARIRLAFGELHRRQHRPGDARPELSRATDIFGRLGATGWRHRAEQELRATGVAVAHRWAPAGQPAPTTVDLSPQQLEVAQLAAAGLSNKEIGERLFLSPRTVSAHLYRVFPKLGITSRSALRDALDALDPPAGDRSEQ